MLLHGMMIAIMRLGAMGLVFGFKWAVCLSFGYHLIMGLLRRDDIDC